MNPIELTEKKLKEIESIIINKTSEVIDMGNDAKRGGITGYMARQIDGEEIDYITHAEGEVHSLKVEIDKMRKKNITGWWEAMQMISDFEEKFFPEEE